MNVCIDKNNFYSILHWSFVNAQNYLILNSKKLKIDLSESGCSACFLILPKNYTNKIYCATSGICKCLLYTNRGPDILSFSLTIDRPSERDRIYTFLRNKLYNKLLKEKEEENKKNNINLVDTENKENNENEKDKNGDKDNKENKDKKEDLINQNNKKLTKKIKINEEELKKNYENSIRYFITSGYTRSFGMLSGADFGLIPNPEINECDLKVGKLRFAVLGNDTFWKILTEPEIRFICFKYTSNKDNVGAIKELWDLIRQKLGTNSKILDKIGFEVIYFDTFF